MSFSDRFRYASAILLQLIVTIFLITVGVETYSRYVDVKKDYDDWASHAEANHNKAVKEIIVRCSSTNKPIIPLENCLLTEIKSYQIDNNESQDLRAQVDMAWWAMLAFYVSLISAVVGAIGIYFLWRSLQQTRQAISTDREIGEAQVRAYLTVEVSDENVIVKERPIINLQIKNTGQSPARNVNHIASIIILDKKLTNGDGFPISVDTSVSSVGISIGAGLHADIDAELDYRIATEAYIDAMKFENRFIYLCAWIFYEDVFGKSRQVWFCAELNKTEETININGESCPLYRWIIARTHNQAD